MVTRSRMSTDEGQTLAAQGRVSRLRIPNLTDIDFGRLRAGRLARLQMTMKQHGVPVCLFYNPANIRYATGTDVMGVWTAGTFARYCVVPADGDRSFLSTKVSRTSRARSSGTCGPLTAGSSAAVPVRNLVGRRVRLGRRAVQPSGLSASEMAD